MECQGGGYMHRGRGGGTREGEEGGEREGGVSLGFFGIHIRFMKHYLDLQ